MKLPAAVVKAFPGFQVEYEAGHKERAEDGSEEDEAHLSPFREFAEEAFSVVLDKLSGLPDRHM